MSRRPVIIGLFALILFGFSSANAATDVVQDIRDLRQMKAWRASTVSLTEGPDTAPDQACGIEKPGTYEALRLDTQIAPDLSDSAATSKIAALDRKISSFLADRGWTPIQIGGKHNGIPDLTRCSGKQRVIAQIYKTTGRCTMNSPCAAYDGFAVVLYLPKDYSKNKELQKP